MSRDTVGSARRASARPRVGLAHLGRPLLAAALAAIAATSVFGLVRSGGAVPPVSAATDARAFLSEYVDPSGRVIRRDQGGDTVSEGQAYALLLAEATGQTPLFDRIWRWTQTHLQQPDGLLAYLANSSGAIEDPTPASDADVLTAWALSRATGPQAAADHAQARRMSAAILARDTISWHGLLLLAAGPWATGAPGTLDPSYWSPSAFADLSRLSHDPRWREVLAGTRSASLILTRGGSQLPPDWARQDGSTLSPTAAPNHQAPTVQYGLDAQRTVVWLATSCRAADRHLAARWWSILSRSSRSGALALTPTGGVLNGSSNALPLIASAAAAGAAGDRAGRDRLILAARREQSAHPTYYGGAWLALGETLIGSRQLGACTDGGIL